LTPPKSHDGPASNLRKRSTGVEPPVDDPDFMSVEGLTMSTRGKIGDEYIDRLQARKGNGYEAPAVSEWIPFAEIRELMGSEPSHDINLPHIEPHRSNVDDGKLYARKVFKEIETKDQEFSNARKAASNVFRTQEATQKLTMECLKLQNLDIADGRQNEQRILKQKPVLSNQVEHEDRVLKHKQVVKRGR
jgi:hypothetical protein